MCYNRIMVKKLEKTILNYRVVVEKEHRKDGAAVYSAACPTLGVFDYGDSLEEALTSIKDGIESMVEFLAEQKKEIPVDNPNESLVTFTQIKAPTRALPFIAP